MKPTPAKPRIIIAHVEGSGTAEFSACAVVKSETTHDPSVGTVSVIALKGSVETKPKKLRLKIWQRVGDREGVDVPKKRQDW